MTGARPKCEEVRILVEYIGLRAIPTRRYGCDRRKNRPTTADSIAILILIPITLWAWPIYWATGQLIAGQPPSPGDWVAANLNQACLIFHWQLVALRRPSPDVRPATEQPSGYGPINVPSLAGDVLFTQSHMVHCVYKKCAAISQRQLYLVPILHMIKDETVQIIHNNRKLVVANYVRNGGKVGHKSGWYYRIICLRFLYSGPVE